MFYVYRFLDKEENIIYVGKSKQDLVQRFRGHLHLPDACYNLTYKIEYIECATVSDMSIKEIYYINKYRHDGAFFNVLDMTDVPVSVEFDDTWKQYKGPLGEHFHHSINYIEGYTTEKVERYNKDGSIDQRKPNSQKGASQFMEGFTESEVDLLIDYFINEINIAENNNQEQIRFRNLLMFIMGINIPHKLNEYIGLRYRDLFDQNNNIKSISLDLGRFQKDQIIEIPLRTVVKETLLAYIKYLGWTYDTNANDLLFETRQHHIPSSRICWRILKDAVNSVGIKKNVGSESLRKTFGYNIYNNAEDKLNAILFLGEIWGQVRDSTIIRYLNLTNDNLDFGLYLGDAFSIGNVDLAKINCLQQPVDKNSDAVLDDSKEYQHIHDEEKTPPQIIRKPESVTDTIIEVKGHRNNRNWSDEELEIIQKHLQQNISIEELSKEYKLHKSIIKFWIYHYKKDEADSQNIFKQGNDHTSQKLSDAKETRKQELVTWFVGTSTKTPRTNKVWTKEIKLEIVKKNLLQYIPQNVLAEEYGAPAGNISRWVSEYKKYGESAFEDKRHKTK